MAKFIVIEGKVVGGHHISDLGIDVPYGEETTINYDRASWSRDLNQSLQAGQVSKKKVVSHNDMLSPRRSSPKPPPAPSKTPERKQEPEKKVTKPSEPSGDMEARLEAQAEANNKLREINESLIETTNKLFDQQKVLMEKMGELLEKPAPVAGIDDIKDALASLGHRESVAQGSSEQGHTSSGGGDVDDDVPTYIPSKIRSGKAKSSEGAEVQSERKTKSSKFSDAAVALKAMRGMESEDGVGEGDGDDESES